jgi:O-antigen biosynthesis protein
MSSRAAVVVGMHRSGTSTVARGLQALSVYLGDNFFEFAPDNPTGYWEDKSIVGLSQRVLEELQIAWDDTSLIARERFQHHRIRLLKLKAVRYFDDAFASVPLWGFKDPRTIRLLPFWLGALRDAGIDDAYVVAIRHPMSVAASLFRRQEIPLEKANLLWLLHNVPFLRDLHEKPLVIVDFDLLAQDPRAQLARIADRLELPTSNGATRREVDRFATEFLDESLRHNVSDADRFDTSSDAGNLTRAAYTALYGLATDRAQADAGFWSGWESISRELELLVDRK